MYPLGRIGKVCLGVEGKRSLAQLEGCYPRPSVLPPAPQHCASGLGHCCVRACLLWANPTRMRPRPAARLQRSPRLDLDHPLYLSLDPPSAALQ